MSLTLNDFYATLREAIGRGTSLDTTLAAKTRQAVRWIERNADPGYQYMKKLYEVTLETTGDYPHVMESLGPRMKCILMFRLVLEDGSYYYLKQINPKDVEELDTATPSGYWLDGTNRIILDAKPSEALEAEILVVEFTEWNTHSNFTHWLLDNAEDVLFNQVMVMMAPWLRDARMIETYKLGRDEALATLDFAKIDLEHYDTDVSMNYGGDV